MAKTRYKGKLVNVKGRRDYRVNKHNRRTQRRNADGGLPSSLCFPEPRNSYYATVCRSTAHKLTQLPGQLLNTVMRRLWKRQCKQGNCWVPAKVESKNRSGITVSVESELVQWFRAPFKKEQERPKLRADLRLFTDAARIWEGLKAERRAAMRAQGQKFEAEDWWLEGGAGGEEKKRMRIREQMGELTSTMAILGIKGEEFVTENEEGDFVFLSPEGTVVGEDGGGGIMMRGMISQFASNSFSLFARCQIPG